jgi:hypothetical protein
MDRDYDACVPLKIMGTPSDHADSPEERAALSATIQAQAEDVFGGLRKATQWLNRLNRLRENRTPLEAIEMNLGLQPGTTILGRIEYGVFSEYFAGYCPSADGPSVIADIF